MDNLSLKERDLKNIWHPCTQMKDHERLPLIPIKSADGVYLEDFDGNRYIDAVSSWWVNLFGHNHPYIKKKIKEQLDTLEHVIFAGFTHEPIVRLSERLVEITPSNLTKCFYADNGSSAIEVAIKMSFHHNKNKGLTKPYFVSLENSYHGETIGALSLGDLGIYKESYEEILIKSIKSYAPKDKSENETLKAVLELRKVFEKNKDMISAFVVEPLVQCAGNMRMYSPKFLQEARKLCKEFNIHFIADEIAVGFGRTGSMFACDQAEIKPDFMALSKGITGGYLPLSVVLLSDEMYDSFYCDYNEHKSFLHSHSYTGNALACAAANAVLDIFEKENILESNRKKIEYIGQKLKLFEKLKVVENIRQTGMIAAFDIKGFRSEERVGLRVYEYALKHGVLLRPLGNTVYFMPPYIITDKEIDKMMDIAYDAVSKLKD
ncbi:MAG: adenosylmethionine--8-amino-7-oxononanoate transaminase [Epsilonproteobacteria bacterium]|nr:adenosylmethionine--8-amino-7-oxononanoate transaminase [Campylobacterota bacterium]